jgi:ribosomal-protein-alanine N-acetyltransferase
MLKTMRLILRKLRLSDINDLIESGNDYDIHYNSFFLMKFPFGKKEAIEVINEQKKSKNLKRFGIEIKDSKIIIGVIDLYNINEKSKKLKLGYWIGHKYRRNGYATEAVKKIIEYVFENFEIEKIIATTLVNNLASQKFLEKLGFEKKKVLPKDRFLDGKYVDSVQWEINK